MKILVAEDSDQQRKHLIYLLIQWGHEVTGTKDGSKALKALLEKPYHVGLLDWEMPIMTAPEICRSLRNVLEKRYPYLILVTQKPYLKNIMPGLSSGADAYLLKPVAPEELKAHLLVAERIIRLHEDLISVQNLLQWRANHDHLTDLPNHRAKETGRNRIVLWQSLASDFSSLEKKILPLKF